VRIIQMIAGGFIAFCVLIIGFVALPMVVSGMHSTSTAHTIIPPTDPAIVIENAPAPAEKPSTSAPDTLHLATIWNAWMQRHDVSQSAIAIGRNGLIHSTAGAERNADQAYPIASLSKAVTGMCFNNLLEQSPYNWDTTLSQLTPVWDRLGMAPHPELAKLPLSALVTHTSGFPKNIDADETAGEGRNLYTQIHFARSALRDPKHLSSDPSHTYSNVNFALLGQIIEGMTGRSYGEYCHQSVMVPAKAETAHVGGPMWATAGFGGWSVSASDYARFVMHWYGPERPWVQNPEAFAYDRKSGAGFGVFHRKTASTTTLHHSGLWRSKTASRQIGAFFAISNTGTVFAANWQGSLPPEAYRDLRESITTALR
jgi:CubicO group peptidase (beta-lactamase class C family)